MYPAGPLVSALVSKYSCRLITIIGSVTCAAGIFLSSFATSLDMLIVLYGVIGGQSCIEVNLFKNHLNELLRLIERRHAQMGRPSACRDWQAQW